MLCQGVAEGAVCFPICFSSFFSLLTSTPWMCFLSQWISSLISARAPRRFSPLGNNKLPAAGNIFRKFIDRQGGTGTMRLLCTPRDDLSRAEVYRCTRIIARRTYIHELDAERLRSM